MAPLPIPLALASSMWMRRGRLRRTAAVTASVKSVLVQREGLWEGGVNQRASVTLVVHTCVRRVVVGRGKRDHTTGHFMIQAACASDGDLTTHDHISLCMYVSAHSPSARATVGRSPSSSS